MWAPVWAPVWAFVCMNACVCVCVCALYQHSSVYLCVHAHLHTGVCSCRCVHVGAHSSVHVCPTLVAEVGALMGAAVTLQPLHDTHLLWHTGLGATGAPGETERCQQGGGLCTDPWNQQLPRSPRPPWG